MDADITGPSIPRLLALTNQHAYGNEKQQLIPIESKEGIKVMSLNFLVQSESDPVIWRGPVIGGVVKQFYTDVVWGDLDVLLIDMPPGTGDVALTIMQSIPVQGVVMVSTPQPMVSMIVEKLVTCVRKWKSKFLVSLKIWRIWNVQIVVKELNSTRRKMWKHCVIQLVQNYMEHFLCWI